MEEMTAAASGMGFDPFSNHTNADLPSVKTIFFIHLQTLI